MLPTAENLAAFIQADLDTATATLALDFATAVVSDYTRGVGFEAAEPAGGLGHVILQVAARLYRNPDQLRTQAVGDLSTTWAEPGWSGFTIGELAVLHRYRRRAG